MTLSADSRALDWAFCAVVLLIAAILLSLPVFPSADGSVHLYYAHIMGQLLGSQPGVYGDYFELRRVIGPYSLQYFYSAGMEALVGANWAEKIFVALIVILTGASFRFFAAGLGRNASLVSLWAAPLLLPWTLTAGFFNFCLAVPLMLFGLGCWSRLRGANGRRWLALFVLSLALLVISHPVPLLLLIALAALDLLLQLAQAGGWTIPAARRQCAALGLACAALLAPILIADHSRVAHDATHLGPSPDVWHDFFHALRLVVFDEVPGLGSGYRVMAALLAPVALWAILRGGWRRWRAGDFRAADRMGLAALLLILGSLLLPEAVNGSHFFAQRLWWPAWLIALAAAGGVEVFGRRRRLLIGGALWMATLTIYCIFANLAPAAHRMAAIDAAPLPSGKKGLYLAAPSVDASYGLAFGVYSWSGARAFEHRQSILLNSPWLGITISPLRARAGSPLFVNRPELMAYSAKVRFDSIVDMPRAYASEMLVDADFRRASLAAADFIFYVDPVEGRESIRRALDKLSLLDESRWRCAIAESYAICDKTK